ncbi:DUF1559 domain-containing protein, partial [bacterium]
MQQYLPSILKIFLVLVILSVGAAVMLPVGSPSRGNSKRSQCQSNLKQIGLAVKQYVQDYDERFPPVAVVKQGNWAGSIQPYLKSWQLLQCPSDDSRALMKTDYFYNSNLAKVFEKDIEVVPQTVLLGEGRSDSPTNYAFPSFPSEWLKDEKSPLYRHLDGANIAFA